MHPHPKPKFTYVMNPDKELEALSNHKIHRKIPEKSEDKLLIATWNLTNFGLQKRLVKHLKIMAHILGFFDIIAVQEIADDMEQFYKMVKYMGDKWDFVVTDTAGNKERLGYIFDKTKVTPVGLVAELAMRGYERRKLTIFVGDEKAEKEFEGYNRNPYLVTFKVKDFEFTIVNVHLYWSNYNMRILETRALSQWAKKRVKSAYPPNNDILLLGDFNMPKLSDDDDVYHELTQGGLKVPKYNTELVGSNLAGDKHYDELAFFPSRTQADFTGKMGVFDFDKALFKDLWSDDDKDAQKKFYRYVRYYVADHRPLWAQFEL